MERIDVESLKKEVLCTSSILSFDNIAIYSNLLIVYSGNDLSNGIVFEIDENNRVSQEYTIFESMISNEFTEGEYRISADYKQIYYVDNNDIMKFTDLILLNVRINILIELIILNC